MRSAAVSCAAARAARIIAVPPLAWTFTIHTPSSVAAATAVATVFGMSWNFRSRNTRSPRSVERPDDRRAFGGEQPAADLEAADRSTQRVGEPQRLGARLDVERHQDLVYVLSHAFSRALVSTVPTTSCSRAILCVVM